MSSPERDANSTQHFQTNGAKKDSSETDSLATSAWCSSWSQQSFGFLNKYSHSTQETQAFASPDSSPWPLHLLYFGKREKYCSWKTESGCFERHPLLCEDEGSHYCPLLRLVKISPWWIELAEKASSSEKDPYALLACLRTFLNYRTLVLYQEHRVSRSKQPSALFLSRVQLEIP